MELPAFFAAAPRIALRDPLAAFLGAARDGILEFQYADVVKLAGHSCPTVASAYLMTRSALKALYPTGLPVRGEIEVALRDGATAGVTGVVANVASLLTGAARETGFKGLGGRFDRRNRLSFDAPIADQIRFTRVDSGVAVTVSARLDRVPSDPRVATLLPKCLDGAATADEEARFRQLWQGRVRTLLVDRADDPDVIVVRMHPG